MRCAETEASGGPGKIKQQSSGVTQKLARWLGKRKG